MSIPVSDLTPAPPSLPARGRRRTVRPAVAALVALLAGVAVVVSVSLVGQEGASIPTFPSLVDHPDSSIHGTVAYYANDSGCIRLVAASGQSSKTLWCLPKPDPASWAATGKPAGPQLVWRSDRQLEVTMFLMQPGPGLSLRPGWQKIIDVRTGAVVDVPTAQLPAAPTGSTEPSISPSGERLSYALDAGTGRVKVTLIDATGTRTLLSVHGPGHYGYRFGPVFWAPNWQWVAASDDGRILVLTPTAPPLTRVLVTGSGGGAGGGTAGPAFAVTGADLLTSTQ